MNIRCVFVGHDDEEDLPSGHGFCRRCKLYSDHPARLRGAKIRRLARNWSPIGLRFTRYDVKVQVGLDRPVALSVSVRLHFRWERIGELPGIHAWVNVWRLNVHAHVGGGWQDEDGDRRTLLGTYATFQTYGLRYIGCWLGHKPRYASGMLGYVYCSRCKTSLELADADPRKAVAL